MNEPYVPRVSRRAALQWIASSSLAAILPRAGWAEMGTTIVFNPTPKGYGTDPNLSSPAAMWPRIMDSRQLQMTAVLSDLILPASQTAPAPSALGVPEFVDEWVSAPYPQQQEDRKLIVAGLGWIDAETQHRWKQDFLQIDDPARRNVLDDIAAKPLRPASLGQLNRFFLQLRFLIVAAYYTTPEGFQDIGYSGNVALPRYRSITAQEQAILDTALSKLGLLPSQKDFRS